MSTALAALRGALAYMSSRCKHEWTYWVHDPAYGTWSHTCTKCRVSEVVGQRPKDYTE